MKLETKIPCVFLTLLNFLIVLNTYLSESIKKENKYEMSYKLSENILKMKKNMEAPNTGNECRSDASIEKFKINKEDCN